MNSMKAVSFDQYGNVDVLQYKDTPCPTPGDGEVLIQAQAASVNPFDCAVRAGYVAGYFNYNLPLIPGLDVAGTVVETGAGVTQFVPGDMVYARIDPARNGAYAEYVLACAEETACSPLTLKPVQAAGIPHAAMTAWNLVETARLTPGQTVLIHAAAGGVGHFAVQFAKMRGARVIGTASGVNQDFLREIGVDVPVDYTTTPFESVAHDVDAVFDTVGGETQQRSWGTLKRGGILLSIVQPPSQETADSYGVRQVFAGAGMAAGELLAKFAAMVDSGQLRVTVSKVLPLEEIQQAHKLVESRHTRGKLVLEIGQ